MSFFMPTQDVRRMLTRVGAVLLTVGIVLACSSYTAILIFYALALGHTMIAFLYQKDAGKWSAWKLVLGVLVLMVLAFLCNLDVILGFVATSFAFIVHMMLDEAHLFGEKPSLIRTLESLPFIALWGALTLNVAYDIEFFVPAFVLACALLLLRGFFAHAQAIRADTLTLTLLTWAVLACSACIAITFYGVTIEPVIWFFGLASVHFLIWYGDYFARVAGDAVRRRTYVLRTLAVNAVSFTLAGLFAYGLAPALIIFFGTGFVNAWALFHIGSSLRVSTIRTALGIS